MQIDRPQNYTYPDLCLFAMDCQVRTCRPARASAAEPVLHDRMDMHWTCTGQDGSNCCCRGATWASCVRLHQQNLLQLVHAHLVLQKVFAMPIHLSTAFTS